MSAVSETIVREYFEAQGFMVQQPVKYQVAARGKLPLEEIDLIAWNPRLSATTMPEDLMWTSSDLRRISCAVIGIRGWHTDRFSPALIETSPEVFRFGEEDVEREVRRLTGYEGRIARVLCLPGLPASADLRAQALERMKAKRIDGLLSFRSMLLELASGLEIQNNYEKSDLLQLLRILKNYGLLRDAQLELFDQRRRGGR